MIEVGAEGLFHVNSGEGFLICTGEIDMGIQPTTEDMELISAFNELHIRPHSIRKPPTSRRSLLSLKIVYLETLDFKHMSVRL